MLLKNFVKLTNNFIHLQATLNDTVKILSDNKAGSVVFLENKQPKGILTERDIVYLYEEKIDFHLQAFRFAKKEVITAHENYNLEYALSLMIDNRIRRIIVVDDDDNYKGTIRQEELIFEFEKDVYRSHIKILDLKERLQKALLVSKEESIQDTLNLMTQNHRGSVVVMDKSTPLGIVTESDVLKIANSYEYIQKNVCELMTSPIVTLQSSAYLYEVVDIMKQKQIRRLVVHHNDEYYVVSSKDILHNIKDHYGSFLELKIKEDRQTFNNLNQAFIEVIDLGKEQVIHWMNLCAKKSFQQVGIEDSIALVLGAKKWEEVFEQLKVYGEVNEVSVIIKKRHYHLNALFMNVLGTNIAKIFLTDITHLEVMEQKFHDEVQRLERDSQELEYRFKKTFDNAALGITHLSLSGEFLYANKKFSELVGYEVEALLQKSFHDITHPEDLEEDVTQLEELVRNQMSSVNMSKRYIKKDASVIWVDVMVSLIKAQEDKPAFFVTFVNDITDRIVLENSLMQKERRFKLLYDRAPLGYLSLDTTGLILNTNDMVLKMLGFSKEEVLGKSFFNFVTEGERSNVKTRMAELFENKNISNVILSIRCANNKSITVRLEGRSEYDDVLQTQKIYCMLEDITENIQAKDEKNKMLQKLKQAQHMAHIGSFEWDSVGNITKWSDEALLIHGIADKTPPNKLKSYVALVHEEDRVRVFRHIRKCLRSDKAFDLTYRLANNEHYVKVVGKVIRENGYVKVDGIVQDITQQKLADLRILKEKELNKTYLNTVQVMIISFDLDGNITLANTRACELLGFSEVEMLGKQWLESFFSQTRRKKLKERYHDLLQDNAISQQRFVEKIVTKEGKWLDIDWRCSVLYDEHAKAIGVLTTGIDVTQTKMQERILKRSASVFNNTTEGIVICDDSNNIIDVNLAFTNITGYEKQECLGKNPKFLNSGRQNRDFYMKMWKHLKEYGHWRGEIWNRKKDGSIYPELLNINTVEDSEGHILNFIGIFSDITNLKKTQDELEFMAHHDMLTNLPNRLLLQARLNHSLARSKRNNKNTAVLFLDLDRFKHINDSFGHSAGDALLKEVARRLKACLRQEDTLARIGGDEFIVVLEEIKKEHIERVISKIFEVFHKAFFIEGNEFYFTTSVGVSLAPDDGMQADELIKNADIAMYKAKESGRNTYRYYTEALSQQAFEHTLLVSELRQALEKKEFVLYYQPQVDMQKQEVVGVEALIRWRHPNLGLVSPDRFIPTAEEIGLIEPIGEWVVQEACAQLKHWQEAGVCVGKMSVNVSGRQFLQKNIVEVLERVISQSGVAFSSIELEMTESFLMQDAEKSSQILKALKGLGVSLAIDDFGTGYSSLSYLKKFPIDKLKIDKSFVQDIPFDENDEAITKAIIAMAKSLGIELIAEGVEVLAQATFLLEQDCFLAQGYYYAAPKKAEEVEKFIQTFNKKEN